VRDFNVARLGMRKQVKEQEKQQDLGQSMHMHTLTHPPFCFPITDWAPYDRARCMPAWVGVPIFRVRG
jgi:hypothetical protein